MKYRSKLEDYYIALKEEGYSINKMAHYIADNDTEIGIGYSSIYRHLTTIKREKEDAITVTDKASWRVVKDSYVFEVGKELKTFPVSVIDDIFLHYSRRGYNFTRLKVQQKFDISPKNFNAISRTFHLSKDCDLVSPYTKETTSEEDLNRILDSQIRKIVKSGERTLDKYQEELNKRYRKALEKEKRKELWNNELISDLLDKLVDIKEIKVPKREAYSIDELVVAITDLHVGAKYKKNLISEDYDMGVFIDKIQKSVVLTNDKGAKNVDFVVSGDIVESLNAVMHPDQFKGLEEEGYGTDVMFRLYEIFVREIVEKVENLRSLNFVSGNHDRSQGNNKLADSAAVDILVYLLKQLFMLNGSNIQVNYDPDVLAFDTKGFGVITGHGHKGIHNRDSAFIVENFAIDRNKFQFILLGHLHTFTCKPGDDSYNHRKIVMPSIVTANKYSDVDLGRGAQSGVTFLWTNRFGRPSMLIENI